MTANSAFVPRPWPESRIDRRTSRSPGSLTRAQQRPRCTDGTPGRSRHTNSGATSYHLRQLADVGLVEDDPDHSNRRDRAWRAAHDATSWRSAEFADDPNARAADNWLLRHQAQVASGWLHDWLEVRDDWSEEWRDAADQSDYHLELTASDLRALMDDLHEVMRRHRERAGTTDAAERVTVLLRAFPSPERRV